MARSAERAISHLVDLILVNGKPDFSRVLNAIRMLSFQHSSRKLLVRKKIFHLNLYIHNVTRLPFLTLSNPDSRPSDLLDADLFI